MKILSTKNRAGKLLLSAVGCYAIAFATGCQSDIGGQTLPSPYYLTDDIQYFQTGPKFKLSQEAAAMKAYRESQNLKDPPVMSPIQSPLAPAVPPPPAPAQIP
jgi:hypothetical protein